MSNTQELFLELAINGFAVTESPSLQVRIEGSVYGIFIDDDYDRELLNTILAKYEEIIDTKATYRIREYVYMTVFSILEEDLVC